MGALLLHGVIAEIELKSNQFDPSVAVGDFAVLNTGQGFVKFSGQFPHLVV